VVLTFKEATNIFDKMSGLYCLMAKLIYGCGLRLQECLNLRIKDVDIEQGIVIVRSGKGDKDRRTVLPESLKDALLHQISSVKRKYMSRTGKIIQNGVYLPGALEKKISECGERVEFGSGSFLQKLFLLIREAALSAVIISTQQRCREHSRKQ